MDLSGFNKLKTVKGAKNVLDGDHLWRGRFMANPLNLICVALLHFSNKKKTMNSTSIHAKSSQGPLPVSIRIGFHLHFTPLYLGFLLKLILPSSSTSTAKKPEKKNAFRATELTSLVHGHAFVHQLHRSHHFWLLKWDRPACIACH